MNKLVLPPFEHKVKREGNGTKIFDIIRKKYVVLTPEEWVRQHLIHYLIHHLGYPSSLIKIESGHKYNELQKRTDLLVYDRRGKVFLLVECKSASQAITKSNLFQVATYNHTVKARNVALVNGVAFACCKITEGSQKLTWLEGMPAYPK